MKPVMWILAAVGFLMFMVQCGNDNIAGNASQTGNVRGRLAKADGTPAAGVTIRFFPVDNAPRQVAKRMAALDSVTTDSYGNFGVDLDSGTYNLLAATDSTAAFTDSVTAGVDTAIVDTMKDPGSLRARVQLQGSDDPRTVFVLVMGTNIWAGPDAAGDFALSSMAEGTYNVRILTTLDLYEPLDTVLSIRSATADTLALPIQLKYTGIPVPTGLKITYDTLKQIVTLTWNKPKTGRPVAGYTIYRKRSDSTAAAILASGVTDTVYHDSTGIQDKTYEYRVAAVDAQGSEGVKSTEDSIVITSAFRFILSFGSAGSNDGQFNEPGEMAADSTGNVYVLDPFNTQGKIHKYDANGVLIKTWTAGAFGELRDVEISRDTLYVLDRRNKRMKLFDTAGVSLGTWAISTTADPLNFTTLGGVAFIVDMQNNQVLKYTLGGDSMTAWSSIGGNTFRALRAITSSRAGALYLRDSDSLGYIADSLGNLVSAFKIDRTAAGSAYSQWFHLDNGCLTYAAIEEHAIFIIDKNGKMLAKFGNRGSASGQFQWPASVIESSGKILVSDAQNSRVQVFSE